MPGGEPVLSLVLSKAKEQAKEPGIRALPPGRHGGAGPSTALRPGLQAWDRYAYTLNNPLRYTDPSGHLVCSDRHVAEGDCSDEGIGFWRFGITLIGNWRSTDTERMRKEIITLASTLADLCGNTCSEITPYKVINEVFGNKAIRLLDDGNGAGCEVLNCSEGTGGWMSNPDAEGLIIHEFGHIFDHKITSEWGFGRKELRSTTIIDALGNYVEGIPLSGGAWTRTNNGYRCDTYPCQQHPLNTEGGNDPGEDFADMFMNFVLDYSSLYDPGGFAENLAGRARYDWMHSHLLEWIPMAVQH